MTPITKRTLVSAVGLVVFLSLAAGSGEERKERRPKVPEATPVVLDADDDGVPDESDCAPEDPSATGTRDEDQDCDGIPDDDDCQPKDPSSTTTRIDDTDCDNVLNEDDCDPDDDAIGSKSADTDCDGVPNADDCDPTGHTDDMDCDGVVSTLDCDDTDSSVRSSTATDGDCDGIADSRDCAPSDPKNDGDECVISFHTKLEELCKQFDDAPNEIVEGQLVNKARQITKSAVLTNVRGTLDSIDADRDAQNMTISISAGKSYTFAVEGLTSPIKSGTPVYNSVVNMSEGQCVIFSARSLEGVAIFQRSEVCSGVAGRLYGAKFTSVKNCPEQSD